MLAILAMAACTDSASATDLHPEGPPMVEQVRMVEIYAIGDVMGLERTVFGFGGHELASADDAHPVAAAKADGNRLRVIMDELLRGNSLEEIGCRYVVDEDAYDRVPVGATPDDVARCSAAQDVLPSRCPGSNRLSMCLCKKDSGCLSGTKLDGTPNITPVGESVGILDLDQDGAADNMHFIDGAVAVTCGAITVPVDLDASYWNPSGNQQRPAQGGFDALGPAIVLVPRGSMPTSRDCGLTFAPDVVDKSDIRVCAPADGDIAAGCAPGDTTAIAFKIEPLGFKINSNVMDMNQSRTEDVKILANARLDAASLASITVTEAPATAYTQFTATTGTDAGAKEITIRWTAAGGLTAMTRYTITLPAGVTDAYQQPAPQPFQISFTTGP